MDWNTFAQNLLVPGISIVEKVVRSILVFAFLVIGLRIFGRRELAQLNTSDLVVLLLLSNTVQNAIIGNDNSLVGGLVGAVVLLSLDAGLNRLFYGNTRLARWFEGNQIYLIRNGMLMRAQLKRLALNQDDLQRAIHKQGLSSISEVQDCILEADGDITIIPKKASEDLKQIQVQLELLTAQQQKILEQLQKAS
jgi:uncharacterized membrane protein YcaP (DUF421 family)